MVAIALFLLIFWAVFILQGWAFRQRPNRIIYDGDGTIVFFDPWLALDEWIYDHLGGRDG